MVVFNDFHPELCGHRVTSPEDSLVDRQHDIGSMLASPGFPCPGHIIPKVRVFFPCSQRGMADIKLQLELFLGL